MYNTDRHTQTHQSVVHELSTVSHRYKQLDCLATKYPKQSYYIVGQSAVSQNLQLRIKHVVTLKHCKMG